jgi:hypothetical protein
VTAQNSLTGKRFSTTTDITGAWSLTSPWERRRRWSPQASPPATTRP